MTKETEIHFSKIHPVLEIKNFIDEETASQVISFLDHNDFDDDECWGAVCFRRYWVKQKPERAEETPSLLRPSDEIILEQINGTIGKEVNRFLEMKPEEIKFSKFKGHKHPTASFTRKHGFEPGLAACILPLNDDYEGGEFFIDQPPVEMKLNARSLYIFKEGQHVEHGVKEVYSGTRLSLVSHWQKTGHPYDHAGANN